MKNIGFNFTTNDFRYGVIEGTKRSPSLIEKDKIVYPKNMDIRELSGWFETQINLLLDKHLPNNIGYKMPLNFGKIKQIQNSTYPLGILNLSSNKNEINIKSYTSAGINATKFGLTKNDDVYEYTDLLLGIHRPYWDKQAKDAVITAWFLLP